MTEVEKAKEENPDLWIQTGIPIEAMEFFAGLQEKRGLSNEFLDSGLGLPKGGWKKYLRGDRNLDFVQFWQLSKLFQVKLKIETNSLGIQISEVE